MRIRVNDLKHALNEGTYIWIKQNMLNVVASRHCFAFGWYCLLVIIVVALSFMLLKNYENLFAPDSIFLTTASHSM